MVDALSSWLAQQCEEFSRSDVPSLQSAPVDASETAADSSSLSAPRSFLRKSQVASTPHQTVQRSPFQRPRAVEDRPVAVSPVQASHPFIHIPEVGKAPGRRPASHFVEGWSVRLTRFLEMPLNLHCARMSGMIEKVLFESKERASVRLEGCTALSFWLRVDEWSTELRRRPRGCDVACALPSRPSDTVFARSGGRRSPVSAPSV